MEGNFTKLFSKTKMEEGGGDFITDELMSTSHKVLIIQMLSMYTRTRIIFLPSFTSRVVEL